MAAINYGSNRDNLNDQICHWNNLERNRARGYELKAEFLPYNGDTRVFLYVHQGNARVFVIFESQHFVFINPRDGNRFAQFYEHDLAGRQDFRIVPPQPAEYSVRRVEQREEVVVMSSITIDRDAFMVLQSINERLERNSPRNRIQPPRNPGRYTFREDWAIPSYDVSEEVQRTIGQAMTRREEIEKKGEQALQKVIGDEKFKRWKDSGEIHFKGKYGDYTLRGNEAFLTVFQQVGPKKVEHTYPVCIQPKVEGLPIGDVLASKYLMLQGDEDLFMTTGFLRDNTKVRIPDEYKASQNRNPPRSDEEAIR